MTLWHAPDRSCPFVPIGDDFGDDAAAIEANVRRNKRLVGIFKIMHADARPDPGAPPTFEVIGEKKKKTRKDYTPCEERGPTPKKYYRG